MKAVRKLDLHDLLCEIAYAYEPKYGVDKSDDGTYVFYKLAVHPDDTAQYKYSHMTLEPGTYNEMVELFKQFNEAGLK